MRYNPQIHSRHSIRLKEFDYSGNGAYFVTICTYKRECDLGNVVKGEMNQNSSGKIVEEELIVSVDKRPNFQLDVYKIMPNHLHFIVFIKSDVGARRCLAQKNIANQGQSTGLPLQPNVGVMRCITQKRGSIPKSLNEFVGNFKSFTSKRINKLNNTPGIPLWQRNFYEHIIRNEMELDKIRDYIIHNPSNWFLDEDNPINWQKNKIQGGNYG